MTAVLTCPPFFTGIVNITSPALVNAANAISIQFIPEIGTVHLQYWLQPSSNNSGVNMPHFLLRRICFPLMGNTTYQNDENHLKNILRGHLANKESLLRVRENFTRH